MTLDLDAIEAAANEDKLTVGCVMLNPEHFDALLHIARQHDADRAKLAAAEALIEVARTTAVGWDDYRVNGLKEASMARVLVAVEKLHAAVADYDALTPTETPGE